jgi:hypothetical protein
MPLPFKVVLNERAEPLKNTVGVVSFVALINAWPVAGEVVENRDFPSYKKTSLPLVFLPNLKLVLVLPDTM